METNEEKKISTNQNAENINGNVFQTIKIVTNKIIDISPFQKSLNEQKWLLFLLFFIVLVALSGGVYFSKTFYREWKCNTDKIPDFRISISGFILPDSIDLIEKREVIDWEKSLTQKLQKGIDAVIKDTVIQVWDSSCAGKIEGDSKNEWMESAQKIADSTKSGLVVFSHIDNISETELKIQPYFYISLQNSYEAYEILGPYMLGESFSIVSLDPTTRRKAFNDEMQAKILLLSKISMGLTNFSIGKYEIALDIFEDVLSEAQYQSHGEQVLLYVLAGNSAGKAENYEKAIELFQQAINLDAEYSRAYAGLGGIYYMQALNLYKMSENGNKEFDQYSFRNLLEESSEMFISASLAEYKPDAASIEAKVYFGLGNVSLLRFIGGNNIHDIDNAFNCFQKVVEIYSQGAENNSLKLLAAESYGRLGLLSQLVGDCQDALSQYQNAYDLSWELERKQMYSERIREIENKIQTDGNCAVNYRP